MRAQWGHIVKWSELGIPDLTQMGDHCHATSQSCCDMLVTSLLEGWKMPYAQHKACVRVGSLAARKAQTDRELQALEAMKEGKTTQAKNKLDRGKETRAWLKVIPNRLNGSELSEEEFRDNLCLRYGMIPLDLRQRCDGYGQHLTVQHALSCSHGSLWGELDRTGLYPSAVSHEPKNYSGEAAKGTKASGAGSEEEEEEGAEDGSKGGQKQRVVVPKEDRGDIAIHGFWKQGTTSVFDVRVTNLDAPIYQGRDPAGVLAEAEKQKKA
eukprot:12538525-Ditylum_brightwellii.AAC.1